MAVVFMGIYWMIIAVLSWFGCPYIVRKSYRTQAWCKAFQRDIALPDAILGVGLTFMGLKYPSFYQQDAFEFVIGLIAIAVVAFALTFKVRNKYRL